MEALASSHVVSHTASSRSLPTTVATGRVATSNLSVSRSLANQPHACPRAGPPRRVSFSSLSRCPRRPSASRCRHVVRSLKDAAATSPSAVPSLPSLPSLPSTHPLPPQVIPLKDLPAFVARSPLLQRAGLAQADVQRDAPAWGALGGELALQLGFVGGKGEGQAQLEEAQLRRIFQYYLPVFSWCWRQLQQHRRQAQGGKTAPTQAPPLVIGISAPQGCGKTTVVESLEHLFAVTQCTAATVSIDDFYLTAQQQAALREAHPGNRLLELRGNAGSHDLALGVSTLSALKQATAPGEPPGTKVPLPRYDKSAFSGRGDRSPSAQWPGVEGPVDVVLFEGWMLGFHPLPAHQAAAIDPQLGEVNGRLQQYSAWHDMVDSWVVIQVADVDWVFDWRLQAEVAMRATGKPGMTDEQVHDFVTRYIPAYKAYLPALYASGPQGSRPDHTLRIDIDQGRNPVG
ncbi:unnamed protein product [Closterium sp. Yama58-4]|nr:unnamed protein product [Closterium sp. Yama58-4]